MKTASDPRHQKRRRLVQELFSYSLNQRTVINYPDNKKIIAQLDEIDQLIANNAPERPLASINKIDLSILRLGIYELTNRDNLNASVIIDEAIELAKEFGSENSANFINAVLAKIIQA